MINKRLVLKYIKEIMILIAIAFVSPIILGKFGFYESSHAASSKFEKPQEPIQYGNAPISYAPSIERAAPAVVSIHSSKAISAENNPLLKDPFFRQFFGNLQIPNEMQQGVGSGVVVTKDGYILTNNHVISDADEIMVKSSDGKSAKAKVIGSDPETDLAILKTDLTNLPVISMGDSDKLKVGDVVFAIGNPFGVGQTVTQGIISGTKRTNLGIATIENFIQTDAAINPGNSGGALIDASGNLIGINNAIYTRNGGFQGIGFAIPVNTAKDIMGELISSGHITRGWLGITVTRLSDDIRKSINYPKGEGAVIAGVIRGGPAYNAGIKPGDVIISVNNQETKDPSDVLSITAKLKPDTAYPISVVRAGQTLDFRVMVVKRPLQTKKAAAELHGAPNNQNPTAPREGGIQ